MLKNYDSELRFGILCTIFEQSGKRQGWKGAMGTFMWLLGNNDESGVTKTLPNRLYASNYVTYGIISQLWDLFDFFGFFTLPP